MNILSETKLQKSITQDTIIYGAESQIFNKNIKANFLATEIDLVQIFEVCNNEDTEINKNADMGTVF